MSTTTRMFANFYEREQKAKQATPSFAAALLKFRAAMATAEGDDADRYTKQREGCSCFVGRITLVYDTAADYMNGNAKSAQLEIEALQYPNHHQPLYCIDVDLDALLLEFCIWWRDAPEGEDEQLKTGEIDSDLLDALWPTK
jgi:hypothetical protein